MYLIVGIAAAAAASVLLYNHYKEARPDLATLSTRRAQQLAAVVLVFSRAVEGVIEALSYSVRPEPIGRPQGRPLMDAMDAWEEEPWR